ncbi:MAG: hypothetical protein SNJ69_18170 [Chloroflexaceae bacterium]
MNTRFDVTKAPRWISTEAGQWAYASNPEWRHHADRAFGVAERRRLLDEAERLRRAAVADSVSTDAA